MAACEYYVNGKSDPTHNSVLNYVAETAPANRSSEEVISKLENGGVVFRKSDINDSSKVNTYISKSPNAKTNINHIQNLNTLAQQEFQLASGENLIQITNPEENMQYKTNTLYSVRVNEVALSKMSQIDPTVIASNKEVADRVAETIAGPGSPFAEQYSKIREARERQETEEDKKLRRGDYKINGIEQQLVKLQKAFRAVGVNTKIVFDTELDAQGQISIENGIPTIRVNPNLMEADVAYHEFGHLYIDLLGYDNPTVQRAIQELRDTTLYEEVQARYPELNQEQLDKEVLATAIGLEGAKIERKNPSKLQQLLNKIFRALGRVLGISQGSAAQLAREMFAGDMRIKEFRGALAPYVQKSKAEKRVEKVIGDLRIKIQTAITKLESTPNPNQQQLADLKLQRERLEKVESVEDLISFVNYVTRYVATAEATMENVENNYGPSISEDQRLEMMGDIQQISEWIGGFHSGEYSAMDGLLELLEDRRLPYNGGSPQELDAFINRLTTAMRRMKRLQNRFMDNVVPMQADLLLEYHRPEVNNQLDELIENVRKNKRLVGLNRNTKEYRELQRQKREGEISPEEFADRVVDLNIKQLQSKKIGRETLIKELREAQKNKNWLSYMMDPMIYSSQAGLQLFATHLKNSIYKASDESRKTKYKLKDIYREYAATRGAGVNDAKFNEPILEEHSYYVTDWEASKKGEVKKKKINVVSFVQPVNVGAYYEAEFNTISALAKKHNRPSTQEELKGWQKTTDAIKYYQELNNWYAENSVAVPDAQQQFNKLTSRLNSLNNDKAIAVTAGDIDLAGILDAQIAEVVREINSVYDKKRRVFKGRLAQPNPQKYKNPKYDKLVANKNSVEYRYYEAMLEQYKQSQGRLGKTNQIRNNWDGFSYALPTIRKSALDKAIEQGAVTAGKDMLQDSFQILETDTEYGVLVGLNGEKLQTVPVFYTNPVDQSDVSRDVIGSILRFDHMSNMFEQKSRILASVESMRTIIENRGTIEESSTGIPGVNQAARRLKGMADRLVKQDKSTNPDNHLRHLNEFIDSVFYGEVDLKNNIKKTFTIGGKEFNLDLSGTKVARTVSLLTSITSLAANKLQGVNQAMIDNERLLEEAIAGEFYGKKNLAWATSMFGQQLVGLKDGTLKDFKAFAADNKMLQAAELFDAFSDFTDRFGVDVSGNRAKKLFSTDSAFAYQNAAEFQTALVRMLSLMDSYTGKLEDKNGNVIMNDKGKPANLWDVLVKDKNGMYVVDPKVANFDLMTFRNTLSGIQKKTNQLKGPFDRAMAERRAVGKAVMIFRKYLLPGFRRRYGHGGLGDMGYLHVDTETGTVSQGMYISFLNYLRDQAKGLVNGQPNVWGMLSKQEKANVRRTTLEVFFGMMAFWLYGVLKGMAADADDEDEAATYMFWAYQFRRLNTELGQFRTEEFFNALESPTAAVRPLSNLIDLGHHLLFRELPYAFGASGEQLEKDLFYSRKSGRYNKGDRKLWKKLEKSIPLWSGLNKNADEAIKWFDLNN